VGVTIEYYVKLEISYINVDMSLKSDNVEFLPPIFMPCFGSHFENGRHVENLENAELLL
jgi:hypothetical protein